MAQRSKKAKKTRVSKLELRLRAKKGWETRRKKYSKSEISHAAKKGSAARVLYRIERKKNAAKIAAANSPEDEILELKRQLAEQAELIAKQQAELLGMKIELDPLRDLRMKSFSEEDWQKLWKAENNAQFDAVAREIAESTGMQLREIYSNWLSP
jgi:hypothetical protein